MKKAILFDLDGTILDTIKDIHQAVNIGLKTYGYQDVTVDKVKKSVGSGAMQMIALCAPSANQEMVKHIHDAYQTSYDQNDKDLTTIYDGMLSLLKELKKKYQLAVVSNKYDHLVQSLIHHYFPNIFDAALGMTKDLPIKPEPDMVLKILYDLNIIPSEAIYIGDSEPDIIVSKRIGMDHIAVSYGYRDEHILKALSPMHLAKDVDTLKKILLSHF
ncbi:MAG: HAD family hydrolase [Firmicutes bacterium]|nr:HAD family hydrolase [Bacillota bacterium]